MISLPWTATTGPPAPGVACTVFAARLPLRSRRALPGALLYALRVRRAVRATDGAIGHAMALDAATLWTVSAWADRSALARFERSSAHRAAKHRLQSDLRPSTYAVWRCRVGDLPVRWAQARRRLRTPDITEPETST
jgi:hypothetical protein